jgi:hypothetical protein
MRSKVLTIQIFILFLASTFLMAQEDKSLKEKLGEIKNDVNKIVISSDKEDVVFEGDEAKQLFEKLKAKKKHKKIKWISDGGNDFDIDDDNVMIFKSSKGEKHIIKEIDSCDNVMIFKHGDLDDLDFNKECKLIKINMEEDNGDKTVTVTTTEDGKDKVEIFKGKEADEYLENMEEGEMLIDIDFDIDSDDDHVWIHDGDHKNRIEKDVRVEIQDGIKKVTFTTKEDGEKKVKVYEGDKADEYLEEVDGGDDHIKIKTIMKDGKKHKKIIIKEIKEEEKKSE